MENEKGMKLIIRKNGFEIWKNNKKYWGKEYWVFAYNKKDKFMLGIERTRKGVKKLIDDFVMFEANYLTTTDNFKSQTKNN